MAGYPANTSCIEEKLIELRPMVEGDAKAVLAVEKAATEFPWSLAQFVSSIKASADTTLFETGGVVGGFIIFQRVLDETSLLNIAVHPKHQGKGFGRLLLEHGLSAQVKAGASRCILEVRISNISAQELYRSLGFQQVGERKNYYPGRDFREDALVMSRDLPQALLNTI